MYTPPGVVRGDGNEPHSARQDSLPGALDDGRTTAGNSPTAQLDEGLLIEEHDTGEHRLGEGRLPKLREDG